MNIFEDISIAEVISHLMGYFSRLLTFYKPGLIHLTPKLRVKTYGPQIIPPKLAIGLCRERTFPQATKIRELPQI